MRNVFFAVIFIPLLLTSCNDAGSLLPSLDLSGDDLAVRSLTEGSVVTSKDSLPLTVNNRNKIRIGDVLRVGIYGKDKTDGDAPLSEQALTVTTLSSLPSLKLPTLVPGLYHLKISHYRNNELLESQSIPLFYEIDSPLIEGLYSHPSAVKPKGDALLEARLSAPEGRDVYLRWSNQSGVISEGSLSKGYDRLQLAAPSRPGVYTYTLELFPQLPEAGTFGFNSAIRKNIQVVVDENEAATSTSELGPEDKFPLLLHLRGNILDSGLRASTSKDFSFLGTRVLDYQDEVFGYRLGKGSKILSKTKSLLGDNQAETFSYSLAARLWIGGLKAGTILTTSSEDGTQKFALSVDSKSMLKADWTLGDATLSAVSASPLETGTAKLLQLTFVKNAEGLELSVFLDSEEIASARKLAEVSKPENGAAAGAPDAAGSPAPAPRSAKNFSLAAGSFEIGNSDNLVFILDELGLFVPDESDLASDAFSLSMQYLYGNKLLLAKRFDAPNFLGSLKSTGKIEVKDGFVSLYPGASLSLPSLALSESKILLELSVSEPRASRESGLRIYTASADGSSLALSADFQFDGTLVQGTSRRAFPALSKDTLKFSVGIEKTDLVVSTGSGEEETVLNLGRVPANQDTLVLETYHRDLAEKTLDLVSLLSYYPKDSSALEF